MQLDPAAGATTLGPYQLLALIRLFVGAAYQGRSESARFLVAVSVDLISRSSPAAGLEPNAPVAFSPSPLAFE